MELNEKTQIKRKYSEHPAIHVVERGPVRNEVLKFIGTRFVTEEEMKNFLSKLEEDRGKVLDGKQWFGRNTKYFEKFENRGQQVWTLSKYGKRVLELIKNGQNKQMVNESRIGLFKF